MEMKEHMTMCRNMMSMMEKMQGMGGMMKGEIQVNRLSAYYLSSARNIAEV